LEDYSRRTYISENALLPGQVHTYFGGSEQHVFRAYRQEIAALKELTSVTNSGNEEHMEGAEKSQSTEGNDDEGKRGRLIAEKVAQIFQEIGLKTATQTYDYSSSGRSFKGDNVYSILYAPRGDATEAIVLVAPVINADGELNEGGVALLLTLARYFKRRSISVILDSM
jgi:glycosylphosphatidylinositol transamidase